MSEPSSPSPLPSLWKYYRAVWQKASAHEGRSWVQSTGAALVATFIGLGSTALIFGLNLDEKRPELVGLAIVLLLAGVWSLVSSLVKAPHLMHNEQLTTINALRLAADALNQRAELAFVELPRKRINGIGIEQFNIGIKNCGSIPARDVAVKIVKIVAMGHESPKTQQEADALVHMHLLHTHGHGAAVSERLVAGADDEFDLATIGEPRIAPTCLRLCHSMRDRHGNADYSHGALPRGRYRITLRIEADNAPVVTADFDLSYCQDNGLALQMLPEPKV